MKRSAAINIAIGLLVILGIAIIYIGLSGTKIIWPPVITGLGFFVISWTICMLKN